MENTYVKDILKKIRNYEIRIRKAVNQQMHGDFRSVFKGSGIEFDDVREYQYGDDVRTIDWNVSAKGHGTFIKTFKEEKEQTVYFLIDISASQDIGKEGQKKIDIAKEIAGVLTMSAIKEMNQVGYFTFTDTKEKYIKPGKGIGFGYELISMLYKYQPKSLKTDLNKALSYILNVVKKRSVFILISDFIDDNYQKNLQSLANKHDLVVIHLSDRREQRIPKMGIIPVFDKESKKTIWINTSSADFRNNITFKFNQSKNTLQDICKKSNASYLQIFTNEDYVTKLIKLFQIRNFRK